MTTLRSKIELVMTALVGLAALSVIVLATATWLRGDVHARADPSSLTRQTGETPRVSSLERAPLLGNHGAKVAILEYSDFECPFCAEFEKETWPRLKEQYIDTGRVLVAFRHLPLAAHRHANRAAIDAACAARQGRFWEM